MQALERGKRGLADALDRATDVLIPFRRGWLIDAIVHLAGEEWPRQGESLSPYYQKFFSQANHAIAIACSFPLLYEVVHDKPVLDVLREKAASQEVEVDILFQNTLADNPIEARDHVIEDAPGIVQLRQDFPKAVHLYWYPDELPLGIAIVDHSSAAIEITPERGHLKNPVTTFRHHDPFFANSMLADFQTLRQEAHRLPT